MRHSPYDMVAAAILYVCASAMFFTHQIVPGAITIGCAVIMTAIATFRKGNR